LARAKQRYAANREHVLRYLRKWIDENPEKRRQAYRRYYEKNYEKILEYNSRQSAQLSAAVNVFRRFFGSIKFKDKHFAKRILQQLGET
jgi:hypothetical protein